MTAMFCKGVESQTWEIFNLNLLLQQVALKNVKEASRVALWMFLLFLAMKISFNSSSFTETSQFDILFRH